MSVESIVHNLFNCVVLDEGQEFGAYNFYNIGNGFVTDFVPSQEQVRLLLEENKSLPINTLFSFEERMYGDINDLLTKQFLHYLEVYGLGMPGLFDLEVNSGQIVSVRFVQGITKNKLLEKIENIVYSNAATKDSAEVKVIIDYYNFKIDINKVKNNEMRILLFNPMVDTFADGDDVVRYICYAATGVSMLIKSKEVIAAVRELKINRSFLTRHKSQLENVFLRHKNIILALKKKNDRTLINEIGRNGKRYHTPLPENFEKTFIARAIETEFIDTDALDKLSVKAKMNYLNVLAERHQNFAISAYNIRNGKVFYKNNEKPVVDAKVLTNIENVVLKSLSKDLSELKNKTILLDANVDYGLPVSAKQTTGRLPNGTRVYINSKNISSGVYWENAGGATDIDLSGITDDGERVGWGQYSGYGHKDIIYSGDVTSAPSGAMEFLTSDRNGPSYSIIANVYNGKDESECEIVVGNTDSKKWIDTTVLREKIKLSSKQTILGFIKNGYFTCWTRRQSNSRVSSNGNVSINSYMPDCWTLRNLLDALNISYDCYQEVNKIYDVDLSYKSFSFDKLSDMLNK